MNGQTKAEKFWQARSQKYDTLQWVRRKRYMESLIDMCSPDKKDTVLDLGTGTGAVAYAFSPKVRNVIGVDLSMDMLHEAQKHNHTDNVQFIRADIRSLPFLDNTFTLVTARMVFHHVLHGLRKAMLEAKRVLKKDGILCVSAGVPPFLSQLITGFSLPIRRPMLFLSFITGLSALIIDLSSVLRYQVLLAKASQRRVSKKTIELVLRLRNSSPSVKSNPLFVLWRIFWHIVCVSGAVWFLTLGSILRINYILIPVYSLILAPLALFSIIVRLRSGIDTVY